MSKANTRPSISSSPSGPQRGGTFPVRRAKAQSARPLHSLDRLVRIGVLSHAKTCATASTTSLPITFSFILASSRLGVSSYFSGQTDIGTAASTTSLPIPFSFILASSRLGVSSYFASRKDRSQPQPCQPWRRNPEERYVCSHQPTPIRFPKLLQERHVVATSLTAGWSNEELRS